MLTVATGRSSALTDTRKEGNFFQEFVWGMVALGVALMALTQDDVWVAMLSSLVGLICLSLLVRRSIIVNMCLLATLPYAVGSFFGYLADITYYPRPTYTDYSDAAIVQASSLLLTAALGVVTGVSQRFQKAARLATQNALYGHTLTKNAGKVFTISWLIALVIGIHDVIFVGFNFSTLVEATRHTYSSQLWVASSPAGVVFALVLSVVLLYGSLTNGGHKRYLSGFIVMWLPTLLAGGRNYLSVTLVAAVAILLLSHRSGRIKALIVSALICGVWVFTVVPTLWSENKLVWLNEWIMPNSLFLSAYYGYIDPEAVGATSFAGQSALMLPAALRPFEVSTFSTVFQELGVTNVGVGGNPWADFASGESAVPWMFAAATLAFFALGTFGAKFSPVPPLVIIGLMAFWGRSSFWTTMFLVVYSIVVSTILLPWAKKRDFAVEDTKGSQLQSPRSTGTQ
ncbi:O-antigen polysaccharide polymerase Wzy [Arthrobacter citreus]|uniref:O-antigen polysaccharide polymerase Wzy n=2 Tax=Arthrobacter citreus TaxID=1670 RepID=A0ABZ2ZZZ1_9MICC